MSDQDAGVLQNERDSLYDWTEKWQMEFSVGKRSFMSVGRTNPAHNSCLNDTSLSRSRCERDLGVIVSADLRPREQCLQARNRAYRVLGFVCRSLIT